MALAPYRFSETQYGRWDRLASLALGIVSHRHQLYVEEFLRRFTQHDNFSLSSLLIVYIPVALGSLKLMDPIIRTIPNFVLQMSQAIR